MSKEILDRLAEMQGKTEDAINTVKSDAAKVDEAIAENLGTAFAMATANGTSIAEIRTSQGELNTKLTELTDNVTKGFEAQTKNTESLTALNETLTGLKNDGNFLTGSDDVESPEIKSAAVSYFKAHYDHLHASDTSAMPFDAKSVDSDKLAQFANIRKGLATMIRSQGAQVVLPDAQRSAISTVTHGDQFFLPIQVIRPEGLSCFTNETNLAARFDNFEMGAHTVVMPVNNVEAYGATWQTEGKCNNEDMDLAQQGLVSMTVGDLVTKGCVTGTMARDSVIDVEGRLLANADQSFDYAITRTYFSDGEGAMDGVFANGNHVSQHTSAAGALDYKDIIKMAVSYPTRFRGGARWFGDCSMAAYLATMCDALGRPMVTLGGGGEFNFFGIPFEQVDQMASSFDPDNALVGGSKGLALINLQEHYMLGRRNNLRGTRDAITGAGCDIIKWYFRISLAGKTKCPNAAQFLKIKEA